jgi:hypothetical protein
VTGEVLLRRARCDDWAAGDLAGIGGAGSRPSPTLLSADDVDAVVPALLAASHADEETGE